MFPHPQPHPRGWGQEGGSQVKNPVAKAGDIGSIPGSGRSTGGEKATHSSILAWEIPWTEEPGRIHSMALKTVGTQFSN